MSNRPNPYRPPTETESLRAKFAVNWKQFWCLNIAITTALGILILVSLLWAKYEQFQIAQQLGRRYASYDHEYHFYPMNGLILLAIVFVIPNAVLFVVQFRSRDSEWESTR